MTLIEKLKLLDRVHQLIRRKATGTPKQLAKRLDMSERCLYNIISLLKEMGGPIYYCSAKQSYCYERSVDFAIGFVETRYSTTLRGGKSAFLTGILVTENYLQCPSLSC